MLVIQCVEKIDNYYELETHIRPYVSVHKSHFFASKFIEANHGIDLYTG